MLLVPALAGCSIGDVRRPPPDRASASPRPVASLPAPRPVADVDEVRHVGVAVAERYGPPYVEFVDAERAYALFATCDGRPPGRECPALLFASRDGGRSWRSLPHPRPVADNQQLYAPNGLLVLGAEPFGWYASTDAGATFTHHPGVAPPPGLTGPDGRFQVTDQDGGRVVRWDGRRLRPLPAQPGLSRVQDVAEAGDLLVAAGADDAGRPYAAVSADQGRSWQRTAVPAPDGAVGVLRPVRAPDGEPWLVGERPDRTGFPALWRWRGRWEPVRADGHPDRVASAVPVGDGRVAVTGPDGAGIVVDGRYERVDWPVGPEHHLRLLGDGTLLARAPDEIVLNVGPVGNRRWIRLVLTGD
ncbi:exo-alpha-sialidase [Micromonospora yasonensis]|uniref:exo-alpha-sialidase n=1 Tax=Micromonospora yasonensis TaxID=1128667 RepID=UPI0022308BF6|nr:exo-alpha-sialidase [Micromonospora yasonensis]MCW3840224.1 exo-alpha-sialidase [Micromonospora yasonensis]